MSRFLTNRTTWCSFARGNSVIRDGNDSVIGAESSRSQGRGDSSSSSSPSPPASSPCPGRPAGRRGAGGSPPPSATALPAHGKEPEIRFAQVNLNKSRPPTAELNKTIFDVALVQEPHVNGNKMSLIELPKRSYLVGNARAAVILVLLTTGRWKPCQRRIWL